MKKFLYSDVLHNVNILQDFIRTYVYTINLCKIKVKVGIYIEHTSHLPKEQKIGPNEQRRSKVTSTMTFRFFLSLCLRLQEAWRPSFTYDPMELSC